MKRRKSRRTRGLRKAASVGFVGGMIAGLALWSLQMTRSRRDLFSSSVLKRYAALGYLEGLHGVETAQLLSEYIRWESKPLLRRKAQRLLQRLQGQLV